jgi:hypothetical protein
LADRASNSQPRKQKLTNSLPTLPPCHPSPPTLCVSDDVRSCHTAPQTREAAHKTSILSRPSARAVGRPERDSLGGRRLALDISPFTLVRHARRKTFDSVPGFHARVVAAGALVGICDDDSLPLLYTIFFPQPLLSTAAETAATSGHVYGCRSCTILPVSPNPAEMPRVPRHGSPLGHKGAKSIPAKGLSFGNWGLRLCRLMNGAQGRKRQCGHGSKFFLNQSGESGLRTRRVFVFKFVG